MKTVNNKRRIELDKGIAYFLGWRIDNSFPDKDKVWRKGNSVELETTFKFSTDWNFLMEVFEAVNNIEGYCVSIYPGRCCIYEKGELEWDVPRKEPNIPLKECVYQCLGEFIEAYNKSKLT